LWNLLREGNRKAFEWIYKREVDALFAYGSRFSKDEELVEDSIHDVFVYIWQKHKSLSELNNIRPYLLVSLRHKILNTAKKNQKVEHKEINDSFVSEQSSVEQKIIQSEFNLELKDRLKVSLEILSARQKEAIFLRYHNGLEYDDICDIMDISYQSVRNLISSGIKKLQKHIKS